MTIRLVVVLFVQLGACLYLVGCSGARAYIGYERVDEYTRTESMKPTPWKCLFTSCGGTENGK